MKIFFDTIYFKQLVITIKNYNYIAITNKKDI